MPRPQRPLDVTQPLHAFASELRKLREEAGSPKYLAMARKVGNVSRTALAEAAGGDHLPTWHTTQSYVRACGGDVDSWRLRWEAARDELDARLQKGQSLESGQLGDLPAAAPARRIRDRWILLVGGSLAVIVLVVLLIANGEDARKSGEMAPSVARSQPPAIVPTGPAVIVQNMVALGRDSLVEDSVPVYLSSRTVPRCRLNACMIRDSVLPTGTSVVATCYVHGALMANYNLDSTEVQSNPARIRSSIWYRLMLPDGRAGYLAEVYIAPASRGGLGLPVCSPDIAITSPDPGATVPGGT